MIDPVAPPGASGPPRYDYRVLSDSDFEELTFTVFLEQFHGAIRLRAPDGGLDFLVRDPDGCVSRGWQAKRFTEQIHWGQCVESLKAAVATYRPARVTFCFARDLTAPQDKLFTKRLRHLYPSVVVDYVSASSLTASITTSAAGDRIARRFFQVPPSAEGLLRTVSAGGPIKGLPHAATRLEAVRQELGADDPHFEYSLVSSHRDGPARLDSDVVMSMTASGPDGNCRLDAFSRVPTSVRVNVVCDGADGEENRRRVEALFRFGGTAHFESGVSLQVENGPRVFARQVDELKALPISLTVHPRLAPWTAILAAGEGDDRVELPIDLKPVESPPDGSTGLLRGSHAGLEFQLAFRFELPDGPGGIDGGWTFRIGGDSVDEHLRAVRLVRRMCRTRTVEIWDRSAQRRGRLDLPISNVTPETESDLEFFELLLGYLAEIEEWSGVRIAVPDVVSREDALAAEESAALIRSRRTWVKIDSWTLCGPRKEAYRLVGGSGYVELQRVTVHSRIFGVKVGLGTLMIPAPVAGLVREEPVVDSAGWVRLYASCGVPASMPAKLLQPPAGAGLSELVSSSRSARRKAIPGRSHDRGWQ